MIFDQFALLIPIIVILAVLASAFKVLREYERGVVFQLGRFWKIKGPGLILVIPFLQQMVRVDLRIRVVDVPHQDVISRDNVLVKVNAVVYYRVLDSQKAVINVEDFNVATSQLAQTTLRSVLGKHELDEILAERDKLNNDIQRILDDQTEAWGIKVSNVELKHVDIDESMIRVIARQAEAERIRRAKIIEAEGEQQAAQKFLEAAEIIGQRNEAMQLRYLTTLQNIANERSSTVVFPFGGIAAGTKRSTPVTNGSWLYTGSGRLRSLCPSMRLSSQNSALTCLLIGQIASLQTLLPLNVRTSLSAPWSPHSSL